MASILVVDDDANARLLLSTLLAHEGHHTVEASNGVDGLALAAQNPPDLVIIDLSMPRMGGPEFVRKLRADPRTASTKVALYTATTIDAATRDFMKIYGVAGALPKPAEPRELLAAIRNIL